jgi:hypothetical protein
LPSRTRFPLLLALLAASAACTDAPDAVPLSQFQWPIVDGTREPRENAVVFIYNDRGAGCTASVIAPRVALTAKHCVQGMTAAGWHVYVGPSIYAISDEYGVTQTRTTPGSSLSNSDIAILILDRDFTQGFKRWEFSPLPGMTSLPTITAIGYGQTAFDSPDTAGVKYRRDGRVVALGPRSDYGLGAGEFITYGENTCQGDSGGPILYSDTVVGIISRGEEGCTGYGIMTRVSYFADLIKQALADTGACVPTAFETCNGADDDCWNGADDDLGPTCGCTDGHAPAAERCDGVDNDCNGRIDDLDHCGCTDGHAPSLEICDGTDNDCNGRIDEICAALGEPCDTHADCPAGAYCDGAACAAGHCRPNATGGAAPIGDPCARAGDCASRFCADGACARPCVSDGLDCFDGQACATLVDACGACRSGGGVPAPYGFGEACRTDTDCRSGWCLAYGDPAACGDACPRYCTVSCGDGGSCPEDSHCRDGACVLGPPSGPGDTCVADADCTVGFCITLGDTSRCVSVCSAEGTCDAGFFCVEGVCWPQATRPGDACTLPGEPCEGGTCLAVGGRLLCVSICNGAGDCASGLACTDDGTGTAGLCLPAAIGGGDGDDGCDCAVPGRAPNAGILGLLLAAGLLLARNRRRP